MAKKYALYPGWAHHSGVYQPSYITAESLAALYGVDLDECVVIAGTRKPREFHAGLIALRPRDDGDYSLPSK